MAGTRTSPELIPLFDFRVEEDDLEAIAETMRSGWLTTGPRTERFEAEFAERHGAKHAVAVSSCTAALHLAYLAAGVGPGDEVIVPSFTFAATAAAAVYCGATPVFADIVGLEAPSIDPDDVAAKITPRTKAVTAVHFAGYAAAIGELRELCDRHGIPLIEDVAHAPGGTAGGQPLGTFGLAGCFSFFSNKVLGVGEGGLLLTDDDRVAEQARRQRSQGMTAGTWERHTAHAPDYDVTQHGFNYRIDDVRSAVLSSRLARLDAELEARRSHTRAYRERLGGLDGLALPFPAAAVEESSCYVMAVMVLEEGRQGPFRLALRERHGVQTSLMYPGIHEFTAYRERFGTTSLPRTERASRSEVCLPLFGHMTAEQIDRVVRAVEAELAG